MHKLPGILMLAALSALAACGGGVPAAVPDVVGLDITDATARLTSANFGSLISGGSGCSDTDDLTGKVVRQRPRAGTQQETKTAVSLTVDCSAP